MLPSIVAHEARENLLDYLQTTFDLSDARLEKALFEHLRGPSGLFRGPYLDIRLPFKTARPGALVPLEIAPRFPPYRHQMRAFERLHSQRGHQPQHTLVTTGTGSGKTECFLYPILDHCLRERQKGKLGIKAILLYPMNALASDQAKRLARTLFDDPRLKDKVSAGLYVGGKGSHPIPDREHLIDDRKTLRQAPPDILLTNYKMLDFLLLRPEDRHLWQGNEADTLRYLVLDELHTYDGAQGSDVACLIRRLKARLGTPSGGLCCVGTSATIGNGAGEEESKERLTGFAREIFDEAIYSDSVIGEERQGIEETLGRDSTLHVHPEPTDRGALDPWGVEAGEWLERQKTLWLGPEGAGLGAVALGDALLKHEFLRSVLRARGGHHRSVEELCERLAIREGWLSAFEAPEQLRVLDSFVALLSQAKKLSAPDGEGKQVEVPFLTVQVQLWMRELRHLVQAVEAEPRFEWRSELGGERKKQEERTRYLPLVRCRDCGCAGLAAEQRIGEARLRDDSEERAIGRKWMERSEDARFILFGHGPRQVGAQAFPEYLCPRCLRVSHEESCACEGSATPPGMAVRVVSNGGNSGNSKHPPPCPECGGEDSLLFLASRASSMLSVAISHLFQTEYNADRKLLAFVDSVQDASHRAGFFGARTYRFNLRSLVQEMLQAQGGRLPLSDIGAQLLRHAEGRADCAERAIPILLPEDLRGHPDYEAFLERGGRGKHPDLKAWLADRLALEVTFEYGFRVRLGRSLEKTGCSTLELEPKALESAVSALAMIAVEDGFLQSHPTALDPGALRHFLSGLLNRLRLRGGIHQKLLRSFVTSSGNAYMLSKAKNPIGPVFGRESVLPRFLLEYPPHGNRRTVFDTFVPRGGNLTWFADWASRSLGLDPVDDGLGTLYRVALERLQAAGLVQAVRTRDRNGREGEEVWGLAPEGLTIVTEVSRLACTECREHVHLPPTMAREWSGRACTKFRCAGHWGEPETVPESYYTRIFRAGRVSRVLPEEHTGLLTRQVRETVEEQFKSGEALNAPNLLVCTPTLEMGIDIGDLSGVLLCAVPPTTSMYLQRIGRAGRATGNALCLTMANSRPHDLYFHADPVAMMSGAVDPPGCFLDAPEMLKRQIVAYAMDDWARVQTELSELPSKTTAVLSDGARYPALFLEHYAEHKPRLVREFLARFDPKTLTAESRDELESFALSDQIAERINKAFDEVRIERARLKRLQVAAKRRVEELKSNPDSGGDNVQQEVEDAESSRRMLGKLYVAFGEKYPLNVLTDAGVLPNYAFPEPGVELDSVVRVDRGDQRRYESYQYVRPASAALRELAPYNSFYAEGRRVRVDEIDLGSSSQPLIESWRLCAACNHSERDEASSAPVSACPGCGDLRWTDVGQRRKLVYFRRSRSLATRLEAASADEGEERQRAFYKTADLIEVVHENRCGARLIEELPFGFELLTRLKLREINFGLDKDDSGPSIEIAGQLVSEEGFRVCRECGRVRPEDPREAILHTVTCKARRNMQTEIDSIYLYREVESEAIRMLIPVAELEVETQQASFKAALQLGMRRRYGGRAPHLQVKSMREPIRGGGHRHYLVLFDAVPGGTGFLADLWRNDGLMDVFEDTLAALRACECVAAGKDGCYRCVFAFQNQRELDVTSRESARKLLEQIVEARAKLTDADTLSDVVLDTKLESELEERFIRALTGRAKQKGSAKKVLKQGSERWEIEVNAKRWEIRPQETLGPTQGVAIQCKPDFLFLPLTPGTDPRPVAVFCDGLAYHVQPDLPTSRLGDDIEKRRAILESGRYRVWSVTWKDVEDFAAGSEKQGPSLLDVGHSAPAQNLLRRWGLLPEATRVGKSSMELLWSWLRFPDQRDWETALVGIGADFLVRMTTLDGPTILEIEKALLSEAEPWPVTPEEQSVGSQTPVFGRLQSRFGVRLLGRLASSVLGGPTPKLPVWTLRLYDDHEHRKDAQVQASWQAFLQAMNLLQFVEGFVFTSTEAIERALAPDADVYPFVRPDEGYSLAAETEPEEAAKVDPLEELFLTEEEQHIASAVLARGGSLPEVGYELDGAQGRCTAEAQLAWPAAKVAVLLEPDPADLRDFEQAGWRVFTQADAFDAIAQAVLESQTESEIR